MPSRIYFISTIKNGKVRKIYLAHGQKELDGITGALKKRGTESEVMEVTNAFYHNQVFDINEFFERRRKMKEMNKMRGQMAERRIKCLETGEVCVNARQFAEHMGIQQSTVHVSITEERSCNGYTFVFTSEPLTIKPKEIKTCHRHSKWPGAFRVTCIENGKTYECVRDAARDNGICMQQVYNSIRSGRPRSGYTFIKTEE